MLWQERYGKGSWFVRYESESWVGKINMIREMIGLGKNIIDEVFMLYQA
jgi:hypothetical protein